MPYAMFILVFLAMITAGAPAPSASSTRDQLVVDTAAPRSTAPALGTNLNYLVDAPLTAPQLAATGARVLRYPGGEKSDTNLWSVPPFDAPHPQIARLGPNQWPGGDRSLINADGSFVRPPLDFDQFLALCAAAGRAAEAVEADASPLLGGIT